MRHLPPITGHPPSAQAERNERLSRRGSLGGAVYVLLFLLLGIGTPHLRDDLLVAVEWGGALASLAVARWILCARWGALRTAKPERWARLYEGVVLATGLTWGLFVYFQILNQDESWASLAVLIPTAGIASGSVLSLAPHYRLILLHSSCMLIPTAIGLLQVRSVEGTTMASLSVAIYFLYLNWQAKEICRTILRERDYGRMIQDQHDRLAVAHAKGVSAARVKERFLSMMGHEIRTPLNGIIGLSDCMLARQVDPETREQATLVRACGVNLLILLNDILTFSETAAARSPVPAEERFDLIACIRQSIEPHRDKADKKGLVIQLQTDADVPGEVRSDRARLEQVLANLVGNAVKFTEAGRITVSVAHCPRDFNRSEIEIAVQDTGVGIHPDQQSEIFDPFSKGDMTYQCRYGGAGIGLAAAKRICEQLGGTLRVQSTPGKGSTFTFHFRVGRLPEVQSPRPAVAQGRGRILIVEDNRINQIVLGKMLERGGYPHDVASSGLEAIQAVARCNYAAIIMDCQMPEMDGYEATRIIRAAETHTRVPIIAATAGTQNSDRQRCLDAGMDDYLSKPLEYDLLLKVVGQWALRNESRAA